MVSIAETLNSSAHVPARREWAIFMAGIQEEKMAGRTGRILSDSRRNCER
jgi:hypothetical protein